MILSVVLVLSVFSNFVSAISYHQPAWMQQDNDFRYKYSNYNPGYSEVEKTTNYYTLNRDYLDFNGQNSEKLKVISTITSRNENGYKVTTLKTTRTSSLTNEDVVYSGYYKPDYVLFNNRVPYRYRDYGVDRYHSQYYYQPRYDSVKMYYNWN